MHVHEYVYVCACMFFISRPRPNSCRKRICGHVQFPHGRLDVSNHLNYRSWDKSKNHTYTCGNHTFPNSVHYQYLESTRPVASYFPSPDDAPQWEMFDFHTVVGSCYIFSCRSTCLKGSLDKPMSNRINDGSVTDGIGPP